MTPCPSLDKVRQLRPHVAQLKELRPGAQANPLGVPSSSSTTFAKTDNGCSSSKLAKVMAKRVLSDTSTDSL